MTMSLTDDADDEIDFDDDDVDDDDGGADGYDFYMISCENAI